MQAKIDPNRDYTPEELAAILDVHVATVRRWLRSGELRAKRHPLRGTYKIRGQDVLDYLRRRGV